MAATDASDDHVVVFLGDGSGSVVEALRVAVDTNPYGLAVGDLNGDGRLDMVTANQEQGTVTVLLNGVAGAPVPTEAPTEMPGPTGPTETLPPTSTSSADGRTGPVPVPFVSLALASLGGLVVTFGWRRRRTHEST
jgi:hypothetical protein